MGAVAQKKYQIIYADPPWRQSRGGKKSVRPKSSGESLPYPVMSLYEISELLRSTKRLGDSSHNFFIWAIDKYLHEAENMMKLMGYKLHARMIWDKVTGIPAAFTIRFGHEYLLWFYYGKLLPVAKDERGKIHSVFREQVGRHSAKPQIAYDIINRLYPDTNKLELFARQKVDGWHSWGNEIESDINLGDSPKEGAGKV